MWRISHEFLGHVVFVEQRRGSNAHRSMQTICWDPWTPHRTVEALAAMRSEFTGETCDESHLAGNDSGVILDVGPERDRTCTIFVFIVSALAIIDAILPEKEVNSPERYTRAVYEHPQFQAWQSCHSRIMNEGPP